MARIVVVVVFVFVIAYVFPRLPLSFLLHLHLQLRLLRGRCCGRWPHHARRGQFAAEPTCAALGARVVHPWAGVGQRTAAVAGARAAEGGGQVFGRDEVE